MTGSCYHGIGGVLSADIAVPEHERELAFYSQVLTTGPTPPWRDDLSNSRGQPVIGLGERVPEYESLPLQWMPHFQVADIAASAARAVELGGRELMHGKDESGRSQWAVLVDPAGAAFGLVPVVEGEANGAGDDGQPGRVGCIAWLALVVPDVAAACGFYEQVIGWTAATDGDESRCEMRGPAGGAAAEILARGDGTAGLPSVWLMSLPVGDLAESLERVRAGGGEVVGELPGAGPVVIRDPLGIHLALQAGP